MLKTRAFSAAASMALAAAAFAQPASFTDLGDLSLASSSGSQAVTLIAANDIQWFKVTLPAVSATDGYVDLWTNGPGTITDTEMGVYTSAGALRGNDDDGGPGNGSRMSFGDTLPTRPGTAAIAPFAGAGLTYAGGNGVIAAADSFWIAVGRFNVTFGAAAWTVTSSNVTAQFATTLNWNIQLPGAPSNPTGATVHAPTSGVAGSTFTASCTVTPGTFPNSTGIAVSCDASAVGGGTVAMLDDGVAPDLVAGNNVFTANITTSGAAPLGAQAMVYTVSDAQLRSSTHNVNYTIVPPPPANDTCATAQAAVIGDNAFNNVSATNDGMVVCVTSAKDVWFVFNPGANPGTASFETCLTLPSMDTVLSVHTSCGGASIACSDDTCGVLSRVTGLALAANTDYYIRVAGFGTAPAGGAGIMTVGFVVGTSPSGVGTNISGGPSSAQLMTVAVTPGTGPASTGLTVTADTTSIGGAPGTAMYDDATNGDVTGGDNIFSLAITNPAVDGVYNVPFTVADAELRSTNGAFTVTTATPASWYEAGDAGDLHTTAQLPIGSGALDSIEGAIGAGEMADMYKISICDSGTFSVTTNHLVTGTQDTQLFLFDSNGAGVQMNDDGTGMGLRSAMANEFVTSNGTYYIAVSHWDNDPNNATPAEIWADQPFGTVRVPDGAGLADPVTASWVGTNTAAFAYRMVFTGTCFFNCIADFNADTVVDFFDYLDFVDAFSLNDPSADFNGDTVIDFFDYLDFVDAFSAGC